MLSARIVNGHVRAYVAQGVQLRDRASNTARQFLKTKLQEVRERVEKSEGALNEYRRQRGIVGRAPSEDKTHVLTQRLARPREGADSAPRPSELRLRPKRIWFARATTIRSQWSLAAV